ncbi:MAG: pyridoxal phosphate-dependent aminotransferase [Rhodothermales bacterium]
MPSVTDPELNPRVAAMQPSATLAMSARAKALVRAGKPVIELSAGEPDFDTPAPICEAGRRAIDEGHTRYTANAGTPALREAIVRKLRDDNGLTYSPAEILCSNGAKQSVAQAIFVLCRPGDEVVIPAPYWVSYPEMVQLAGGESVIVETTPESGYRMGPDELAAALTERTRIVVLNSPSNPTGAVYSRAELEALAEVLRGRDDVFVVSDEIYERVIYDAEHVSFAALDGMRERTVTVNGFSKAYAMTGWRLGYLAAPAWIVEAASTMQGQFTSAPSAITQQAGIAALAMDPEPIRQMVRAFRERRDFVLGALTAIPGVQCPTPEGAFYVFPDVSAYFGRTAPSGRAVANSEDLCFYLLEEHDVALVPGDAFGAPYGIRLSYAASTDDLREAMRRISAGLGALQA